MATFSSGVKCFRSFLIRSLRYLNGRTLSPFPTEAGQSGKVNRAMRAKLTGAWTQRSTRLGCFLLTLSLRPASEAWIVQLTRCPEQTVRKSDAGSVSISTVRVYARWSRSRDPAQPPTPNDFGGEKA